MGVFTGRNQYELVVNAYEFSTNPSGNSSVIGFQLWARVRPGYTNPGTWSSDAIGTYSLTVDGQNWSGSWTPDFRSTNQITLVDDGKTVSHNSDGSKTVTFSFSANSNNDIGSASDSVSLTLTDFVRAPLAPSSAPTLSVSAGVVTVTSATADGRGNTITDYKYRSSTDNSSWSSDVSIGTDRTGTFTASDRGQTYYFQTRAFSSEGGGAWSASSSIFVPAGGRRWNGSSFAPTTIAKRWNGSAWVDLQTAKRWNGSAWVDLT